MNASKIFIACVWLFSVIAWSNKPEDFYENYCARNLVKRESWGAELPQSSMDLDPMKTNMAVHHSAGTSESSTKTVSDIQMAHLRRGFSDIGYHFLVGQDGRVYEGRPLQFAGAHVKGHNTGSIGLNFMGCYDTKECHPPMYPPVAYFTDAMIFAMGRLMGVLAHKYRIDINESSVKGHCEYQGAKTSCPGDQILAKLGDLRSLAAKIKQQLLSGNHEEL